MREKAESFVAAVANAWIVWKQLSRSPHHHHHHYHHPHQHQAQNILSPSPPLASLLFIYCQLLLPVYIMNVFVVCVSFFPLPKN